MKNQRGFTMIELVLYLGLSSFVVMIALSFLTTATKARVETKQKQELQSTVNAVSGSLSYALRNAYQVTVSPSGTRVDVYSHDPAAPLHPVVTTFFIQDGALMTGKAVDNPATVFYRLSDATVTITSPSVPFELISSSVKASLTFSEKDTSVPFDSVFAFRQS